jgi:hypothetical protein
MIASWAAFFVWSIRTFWRTSDDPREARIYAATKFYSAFVTVGLAIFLPRVLVIPEGPYWVKAIYWACLSFPVTLCAGYLGSRIFFAIVDPDRK